MPVIDLDVHVECNVTKFTNCAGGYSGNVCKTVVHVADPVYQVRPHVSCPGSPLQATYCRGERREEDGEGYRRYCVDRGENVMRQARGRQT